MQSAEIPHSQDKNEKYFFNKQHFDFKLRDGYSEEEIARKLGDPTAIAQQYDRSDAQPYAKEKYRWLALVGLGIMDFFAAIFYTVLICFGIGIAAFVLCSMQYVK